MMITKRLSKIAEGVEANVNVSVIPIRLTYFPTGHLIIPKDLLLEVELDMSTPSNRSKLERYRPPSINLG